MSVIRRIQIGENHRSAEVLNRPADDIQTLSGLTLGATFDGFAVRADGIPVVADAATRDARWPLATRQQDQRCFNKATGNVERWTASAWVTDLTGGTIPAGGRTVTSLTAYLDNNKTYNLLDFGAVSGGSSATNTTAFQLAVNTIGTAGGRLIITGDFAFTPPTWPVGLARPLTLVVDGILRPSTTLTLPDFVFFEGIGGASQMLQFHRGTAAEIVPPVGNIPTLKLIGSTNHRVQGLVINGPTGIGILCDATAALGALAIFERVTVAAANVSTSEPFVIDGFFWVWTKDCNFLSLPNSAHRSMRITTSSLAHSSGAGLIYIDNAVLSTYGIQVDAQVAVTQQGNIFLSNVLIENPQGSLLLLDPTNGTIGNIKMSQVGTADEVAISQLIDIVAPGLVENISLSDSDIPQLPISNRPIVGLNWDGARNFDYATGWSLGTAGVKHQWYSLERAGVVDAEILSQGALCGPTAHPFATQNVDQDVLNWGAKTGTAVVTTGVLAPDGSTTAATLSTAAGVDYREIFRTTRTFAVGDWVVFGVWIKSADSTKMPNGASIISLQGGSKFDANGTQVADSTTTAISHDSTRQVSGAWKPITIARKISVGGAANDLALTLKCEVGNPTSYWKPWMVIIPVASAVADDEVIRWKRQLRNLGQNMAAGVIGLYPHQILGWGNDSALSRASAHLLKSDGGFAEPVIAKTTTYTALTTDATITVSAAAPWTLTLPSAVGIAGKHYRIKKTDATANLVTVNGGGTNIDGAATYTGLSAQYKYLTVVSDGAVWQIVGSN